MATKVRTELKQEGIIALLTSDAVASELRKHADRIQKAAGDEFEVSEVYKRGDRIGMAVQPIDEEGRRAEAEDKVLSRAVSQCRS